eukprot:7108698-Alexandrium_andersonii.AAC.1
MTELAAAFLCLLLNHVEQGAAWPTQLLEAKAVFLGKGPNETGDPKDFRVLTICSQVYRKWATVRLADIKSWVSRWIDPSAFGATSGQGADTASWLLAASLEEATPTGEPFSALSLDIEKAFDQIPRALVVEYAVHLGLPRSFICLLYTSPSPRD